ncbi:nitrate- and nitrite sensing domain-containing protein [Phytomonospora sp. NPDC050363]|uniref:sensor histidine kinase n=1 Tax=Phytomonospora sp. NPDC050363 TaxID=3155642 RepID=UPI003405027D
MSKRSEATGGRRRFGIPPLRDIRIRPKLGIILVVPVLALVGLAVVRLLDTGERAVQADEIRTLARFTATVSQLTQDLQVERTAAFDFLDPEDRGDAAGDDDSAAFESAVAATNQSYSDYKAERDGLSDLPELLEQTIRDADNLLINLDTHRADVREKLIADTSAVKRYGGYVTNLLNVHDAIAQVTQDADLALDIRIASLLSRMKEANEREKLTVLATENDRVFSTEEFREFVSQRTSRDLSEANMKAVITVEQRNEVDRILNEADSRSATQVEAQLDNVLPGEKFEDLDYAVWVSAMDERREATRTVEIRLETELVAKAEELRDSVVTRVLVESAIVLLTLTLAVALALIIARSMASSLRQLREGALQMAHVDLPEAVARLRDSEVLGQSTPDEFAERLAEPLRLRNADEIGQVAQAFNIVHKEAVRVAAEQAALRSSVSTMFVNLARRSQILVDRLIGHLDRLERGEEDPDRLGELFQLDHLATRMRRNDENLLVLAGADSARIQREPATVADLLRAAQSEVEQYTRIEFGTILAEREITAAVVNDLVHLVAELFDNATAFSSPDTAVVAEARQVGSEIVVLITDRGIGISPDQIDELNQQLAAPPLVDLAASRMMGLVVVGRLAIRHGVRVTLHPGELGGTVAEVVLPDAVLTDPLGSTGRPSLNGGRPQGEIPAGPTSFNGFASSAPTSYDSPAPQQQSYEENSGSFGMPPPPQQSLFEPVHIPDHDPEPPAPPAVPDREEEDVPTMTFRPAAEDADAMPRRKVMELTGEIVSEAEGALDPDAPVHTPVEGPTEAFPMITLEATTSPSSRSRRTIATGGSTKAEQEKADGESKWAALNDIPSWPPPRSTEKPTPPPSGAADETMEIPIFREVSSAWFTVTPPAQQAVQGAAAPAADVPAPRTSREGGLPARASGRVRSNEPRNDESFFGSAPSVPEVPDLPDLPTRAPAGDPVRGRTGGTHAESTSTRQEESMSDAPPSRETPRTDFWGESSVDDGWRAARAAAAPTATAAEARSENGLPKRTPMAQLVPGSIEIPDEQPMRAQQRDPEGVRGLLSAYHRGVQRGRGGRTVDDDARSRTGRLTNGSGKEHDA